MSYARMQSTEAELKAQIAALLHKAAHINEAEKNEPELDIPAELQRRQARLAAIEAAKARLQERQAQADTQRGRSPGDERKPQGKDGKPKAGRPYKRDFGIPEPKAQSSFTDPDSRIMKRAGGGFDYSYNAQTAVDETAHIIVAAEVVNTSTDVQQLPMVLDAVQTHAGAQPAQVLADAGYRSEAVMAKLAQTHPDTELMIALGREGKAMQGLCPKTQTAIRTRRPWRPSYKPNKARGTTESANGSPSRPTAGSRMCWGFAPVQHARFREGKSRVQTRVHGAESTQDGGDEGCLRGNAVTGADCDFSARLTYLNRAMKIGDGERVHHRLRRKRPLVALGGCSECSAAQTPRAYEISAGGYQN